MPESKSDVSGTVLALGIATALVASWLLFDNDLIPFADTVILLVSLAFPFWVIRKVIRRKKESEINFGDTRKQPLVKHTSRLGLLIFLNLIACLVYFSFMPDFQDTINGRKYYCYTEEGWEHDENKVRVTFRSGMEELHVGYGFAGAGCSDDACYRRMIQEAEANRVLHYDKNLPYNKRFRQ